MVLEQLDRRPIRSRKLKIFHNLAGFLANKNISANQISVFGMFFGILSGYLFYLTNQSSTPLIWIFAAVFIQLRLLANMLDGLVAVESNKASPMGSIYNELPDRISDFAIIIGFSLTPYANLTLGFTASLLAMLTAYIRALGKIAGAQQEYCGPMAKQERMFLITFGAILIASGINNIGEIYLANFVLIIINIGCLITSYRRLKKISYTLKNI